ncbi:MAG: ribosome maturation factor RimM [Bacteroidales bacterium]|nr:ribosome maturation factor RimM [Bacteroidales bacterium]
MIGRDDLVEMGCYNKPHGVNGEISATMLCDIDLLDRFSCLVSDIDGIFVPFFVEGKRPKNEQTALLKIDGIDSDEDLRMLVNKQIFVMKREYEALAAEYDCDEEPADLFIGFEVIEVEGDRVIGEIVDVDDSTENVLFVVEDAMGREVLIPIAEEFIDGIDHEERRIYMNLPLGLLPGDAG